jgi:hypothetical protein
VDWLKRYKLFLLGGACLLIALLVINRKESPRPAIDFTGAGTPRVAVNASSQSGAAEKQEKKTEAKSEPPRAEAKRATRAHVVSREEAPADSADRKTPEAEFDAEEARGEAMAQVQAFNEELATELGTFNPNARKTRLKAAELKRKAAELDGWIESQDTDMQMTAEERQTWQAQREVWVKHAKELRQVAQRLGATRGTKRKVRILAKEISDSLED